MTAITFKDEAAASAWDKQAATAGELSPPLTPSSIHFAADYLGFDPELCSELIDGLCLFSQLPELDSLRGQFAYFLVIRTLGEMRQPTISMECHPSARLFFIYVLLSGLESIRAYHHKLGVDEAITRDTLSDLLLWINQHKEQYSCYGLSQFSWLVGHFTGKLYKLGRLQFMFETFHEPFRAYRNTKTRKLIVMCEPGLQFRADGQFADADGRLSPVVYLSQLDEDKTEIRGLLVDPRGRVTGEQITLNAEEWNCVLRKGSPVLGIHIPAVGPMDLAACGKSFAQGMSFFPAIFPNQPFQAFICGSWLLDPQFAKHLPSTSNITQFLKEFYLHPCPGANGNQTIERVFGFDIKPDVDINTLPTKTALQRRVIQHLKAGGCWRGGGGILFPEDLNWGSQFYREQV